MTYKLSGQYLINLSDKERFVNAVSEIAEGDFHPSNIKYNFVGDYSKAVNSADLDTMILYDIAHEKEHQRQCMFAHLVSPFWHTYSTNYTKLTEIEKFLIFLKVLRECKHVYSKIQLEEILFAIQAKLNITSEISARLQNGKMWHDYFMSDYEPYVISVLNRNKQSFY